MHYWILVKWFDSSRRSGHALSTEDSPVQLIWDIKIVFFFAEGYVPGSYEKARLRFAHAETLLPFSCLLGLFLEGPGECIHVLCILGYISICRLLVVLFLLDTAEFDRIQREEPLQLPPKPPQKRNWKGSIVAPFAGNNVLVLYSCSDNNSSKYFVHVQHNEHPVPMPVSSSWIL